MATAATAKQVKVKQTKPEAVEDSVEGVYEELVKILQRHAPPFRSDVPCMAGGKRSFQLTVPKPVAIPGAYGGKPVDRQMAAILQKGYVGFHLMCVYMNGATKKKLSPALVKLLKGKTVLAREDAGCRSAQGHRSGSGNERQGLSRTRLAVARQFDATAQRLQASETTNPASEPGRRKG